MDKRAHGGILGALLNDALRRAAGAACIIVLALAGTSAQAATKLAFGYSPVLDSVAIFAAKDKGFFAKHDLDVELVPVNLNSNMPAALVSGSIQVGAMNASVFLQAVDGGLDLKLIQNASELPNHNAILGFTARSDLSFESGKSFEGKKISVPGLGSSADILFQKWFVSKGGDPKKVTFIEMASAQAGDALRTKAIDGAVVAEPFLTRIVQGGYGKLIGRVTDGLPGPVIAISYISESGWAQKNPAVVAAVRAAMIEANAWVRDNPNEARTFITTYLKLPKEIVDVLPLPILDDKVTEQGLSFWIEAMKSAGLLRTEIPIKSLTLK
jgi:NitT/TauT family transport system substrate-binding protein